MRREIVGLIAALLLAAGSHAQDVQKLPKKPTAPTGTITGTVYCGDTNLPARKAEIYLLQIGMGSQSSQPAGFTDLEGHFAVNHVPEGTYFVIADLPGYLNPASNLSGPHLAAMSEEERKDLESRMTSATVSASSPAEVSLRLERAAEIDGVVQYDDGSPAIGLEIVLKPRRDPTDKRSFDEPMVPLASEMRHIERVTDDRGHFRIQGVSPGEYLVGVSVPTSNANLSDTNPVVQAVESSELGAMIVYAGNTVRASRAQFIKIESGDASKDVEITIALSKLHTIRGHVVLKSTGQAPPAASVQLEYADNHERARMALAPDGEFEMHYVPEDNYVLEATALSQPIPGFGSDGDEEDPNSADIVSEEMTATSEAAVFRFSLGANGGPDHSAQTLLTVSGDIDDVTIAVPDAPKSEPPPPAQSTTIGSPQ
jgi:hypothetical protein